MHADHSTIVILQHELFKLFLTYYLNYDSTVHVGAPACTTIDYSYNY